MSVNQTWETFDAAPKRKPGRPVIYKPVFVSERDDEARHLESGTRRFGMALFTVRQFLAGLSHDEVREIESPWELLLSSYEDHCDSIEEAEEALRERLREAQEKSPLLTAEEGMTAYQVCQWFDLDQDRAWEKDIIEAWDEFDGEGDELERRLIRLGCKRR